MAVVAALLVAMLTLTVGLPLGLGALGGTALVVLALVAAGWVPHRRGLSQRASLLVTIGLAVAGRGLALATWGDLPIALGLFQVEAPALAVPPRVAQLGLAVALGGGLMACFHLFLRYTALGLLLLLPVGEALPPTAGARSAALGWSGLLAATAGLLLTTTITPLETGAGTSALFPALTGVLVGGPGSLRGVVAGSLLVALWEASVALLWPSFAGVSVLVLLLGALLLMPSGLLGRAAAR
jgi:branched-chain amino acid transport system permease protein